MIEKPDGWRLYANSGLIEDLLPAALDEETGEIKDDILLDEIEELQKQNIDIVEAMALFVKEQQVRQEMLKAEINNMKARVYKSAQDVDSVSKILKDVLRCEKYEGTNFSVTFRKAKAVEIEDINLLPAEYKKTKTEVSPDKTKITQDIKNNIAIDGAKLVETISMKVK